VRLLSQRAQVCRYGGAAFHGGGRKEGEEESPLPYSNGRKQSIDKGRRGYFLEEGDFLGDLVLALVEEEEEEEADAGLPAGVTPGASAGEVEGEEEGAAGDKGEAGDKEAAEVAAGRMKLS